MPTARELLEQADALMRRNRTRDPEPDIPELTDEVAVAIAAKSAKSAMSARSARSASAPARSRGTDVPPQNDDIPELRDAIGEIEEVSIDALPGEDSRWLDSDLGAASITGPAPDSIAVVPPATLRTPAPSAGAVPSGQPSSAQDMPSAASAPVPSTNASTLLAAKVAGTLSGRPAEPPPASDPGFDAMLGMAPAEAAFEQEFTPKNVPAPVAPPAAAFTLDVESPAPGIESPVPGVEMPAPGVDAPAVAPAAPADDPARWVALAEDIRMQVLQRIDIFTDTGLSGELSERLQPIVDRASVDLVSTINREVGHLLRAYVAEAIEREIEKWREANP